MNKLIKKKISIMSEKPQTTRNKIQVVYTEEDAQIIFIDTPGIHKPKHRLGDFMVKIAENTLNEVDAILFMIDAKEGDRKSTRLNSSHVAISYAVFCLKKKKKKNDKEKNNNQCV